LLIDVFCNGNGGLAVVCTVGSYTLCDGAVPTLLALHLETGHNIGSGREKRNSLTSIYPLASFRKHFQMPSEISILVLFWKFIIAEVVRALHQNGKRIKINRDMGQG